MSQHATNQGTTEPSPLPGQEEFCDTNWASDLRGASAAVAKVLALASFPGGHDTTKWRVLAKLRQSTSTPDGDQEKQKQHAHLNKSRPRQSRLIHCIATMFEHSPSVSTHINLHLTYQSIQSTYLQKLLHGFSPRDDLTRLALPSIEAHPIATCHGRTWKSTIRQRETLCFRLSSF